MAWCHSKILNRTQSGSDPRFQHVTSVFQNKPRWAERTTGHGPTTGTSVFCVIWATKQPGRNRGKEPGKRWVYCPGILLDVTDACDLTIRPFIFLSLSLFKGFSGNILSEHPTCSWTFLETILCKLELHIMSKVWKVYLSKRANL